MADPRAVVRAYHQRSKHQPFRFARSLGYLDWDSQPDPFRTYAGAERVDLPLAADEVLTGYDQLFQPGSVPPREFTRASLGAFFELALGLTAWKELGDSRWALRADPSSGNLHPTEGYLINGAGELPAGVWHYVSRDHALERRASPAALTLPDGCVLVGISSIHWREAWKYGERAFRYCQHDAGHVLGTVRLAAAALGWRAQLLAGLGDALIAQLLGLDRDDDYAGLDPLDREHPDALVVIARDTLPTFTTEDAEQLTRELTAAPWSGRANELSSDHHEWEVIDQAAQATTEPGTVSGPFPPLFLQSSRGKGPETAIARESGGSCPDSVPPAGSVRAVGIIRQRRSAVSLDKTTSIGAADFYALLERTLPGAPPFDVLPWRGRVHLALFVHRVDGLEPGLYMLERSEQPHGELVAMLGSKALWERPAGCPDTLRLFCIGRHDYRATSAGISCQQEIAADGAFSLGMLAEFDDALEEGAHWYRRLFWECGLIGQVLYLEAEALGVRGTGIGCYFDDQVHEVIGLEGERFQSLYHFTIGGPVDDPRLATHPPYEHLTR